MEDGIKSTYEKRTRTKWNAEYRMETTVEIKAVSLLWFMEEVLSHWPSRKALAEGLGLDELFNAIEFKNSILDYAGWDDLTHVVIMLRISEVCGFYGITIPDAFQGSQLVAVKP